jgi:hypothetical protein
MTVKKQEEFVKQMMGDHDMLMTGSLSGVRRDSYGMQGHRGGFCEVQQVNSTFPLLSYNDFACSQIDTLLYPKKCNIESKQVTNYLPSPQSKSMQSPSSLQCQSPSKYIITFSLGLMSLSINIE